VLEVTLEELGRVGLAGLSLPHVAELAGINKTSLYRRWPTKQALVAAALELSVPSAGELPDLGSLELDLVNLARALAAFITSPAGMGVMRTVFAEGDSPQTRRLAESRWTTPTRVAPRLVLERAIERGELRPDADLDLLLHALGGAVLHRIFVERSAADARWARRLIRMLAEGVTPRRRR
jgi:AcrR family transcriptional regulator